MMGASELRQQTYLPNDDEDLTGIYEFVTTMSPTGRTRQPGATSSERTSASESSFPTRSTESCAKSSRRCRTVSR